jgi:thiamine kinase-like enzyme
MNEAPYWLHVIAAAQAAGADTWIEDGIAIHRVKGGYNNALFRVQVDGACYACKLCVPDIRQRAAREYSLLQLLFHAGLDLAPKPIYIDESGDLVPFPVLVYNWLPGDPLTPPLARKHLSAFLSSYQLLHSLQPDRVEAQVKDAWFHWFAWEPYLAELEAWTNGYGAWLAHTDSDGPDLRKRLARLVQQCSEAVMLIDTPCTRDVVALRLCRVDQNLANAVWGPDDRLRWVDWEYCGWGDPAMDLAELRWHAALVGLSLEQHRWLRQNYKRPADDPAFEDRLRAWDCIIVARWPFLILRHYQSLIDAPDRLRLNRPTEDPRQARIRLLGFVQRAERFMQTRRAV